MLYYNFFYNFFGQTQTNTGLTKNPLQYPLPCSRDNKVLNLSLNIIILLSFYFLILTRKEVSCQLDQGHGMNNTNFSMSLSLARQKSTRKRGAINIALKGHILHTQF